MARSDRIRSEGEKPKRLVMGIHPVPTMVTLGNLLCGFGAIILAMRAFNPPPFHSFTSEDCLHCAGLLIFAAMVFDVLDGKVARWAKSTSRLGLEMDSLCDLVSFGVAPAVLVKAMIDYELKTTGSFPILDRFIWPMLAIYVSCAALRLARYNVEAESGHRNFFFGMPSPGAAGCVASLAILIVPAQHVPLEPLRGQVVQIEAWQAALHFPLLVALPFIMLGLGLLMVSRVHYPHIGDKLLRGKKSLTHIMVLGLGLALIAAHHEIMLAVSFNGYLLVGLVNELRLQVFRRPVEASAVGTESPPKPEAQEHPLV
jgi:CDP-diacylglycerol---serine O-phosphatidyltransferase